MCHLPALTGEPFVTWLGAEALTALGYVDLQPTGLPSLEARLSWNESCLFCLPQQSLRLLPFSQWTPLRNKLFFKRAVHLHLTVSIMEKAMAPHSSTLAWKIPWTEEPGGLQSMKSLRVGQD